MNLKLIVMSLFVLALGACDSNTAATQQAAASEPTAATAVVAAPTPVEPVQPPVTEPPAVVATKSALQLPPAQQVAVAVTQPLSGEAIYKKSCAGCHATGAAKAPKVGDKVVWKPRIAKGVNALLQSALNGVPGTAMMKRGTCSSCSDAELKATVEYMMAQSK